MDSVETIRGEIARTEALLKLAREKVETLRKDLHEARIERLAVVAGTMEGDAGVCWTNEERVQDAFDEARDDVGRLEDEVYDLFQEEFLAKHRAASVRAA